MNPHRLNTSFDPNSLSGLKMWIDGSDLGTITNTGTTLNSITCKKTGLVFTPGGAVAPLLNPAGGLFPKSSIDFGKTGTSYIYNATGVTVNNPSTIFIVMYWRDSMHTTSILMLCHGTADDSIASGACIPDIVQYTNSGNLVAPSGGAIPSAKFIAAPSTYYGDSSAAGTLRNTRGIYEYNSNLSAAACGIRVNGVVKPLNTAGTLPSTMPFTTIGTPDITYWANGAYGEVLAYDGTLSDPNATLVRTYLKAKWGTP